MLCNVFLLVIMDFLFSQPQNIINKYILVDFLIVTHIYSVSYSCSRISCICSTFDENPCLSQIVCFGKTCNVSKMGLRRSKSYCDKCNRKSNKSSTFARTDENRIKDYSLHVQHANGRTLQSIYILNYSYIDGIT